MRAALDNDALGRKNVVIIVQTLTNDMVVFYKEECLARGARLHLAHIVSGPGARTKCVHTGGAEDTYCVMHRTPGANTWTGVKFTGSLAEVPWMTAAVPIAK